MIWSVSFHTLIQTEREKKCSFGSWQQTERKFFGLFGSRRLYIFGQMDLFLNSCSRFLR